MTRLVARPGLAASVLGVYPAGVPVEGTFMDFNTPTWPELIADWGYALIAEARFGSEHGDLVAVLSAPGQVGVAVIGYGSCSACDALAGCTDMASLKVLGDQVRSTIHWSSNAADADAYLAILCDLEGGKLGYYQFEPEFEAAVDELRVALAVLL